MNKEQLKERIDFNNIREIEFAKLDNQKFDYIQDSEGNNILRVSPLEFKLIEKIKELENRIKELE